MSGASGASASFRRLWALMLTVFVDMVGFLMILPILPLYAKRLGAPIFLIGLMASAYAVAQLATASTWGRLSDGHGRRPMLMLGIAIAATAHLLFGFASSNWAVDRLAPESLIAVLFLLRFVQGGGGASTAVVQAYVADTVVPEERAKALGWISSATSAGVMVGPAIGSAVAYLGPAAPGLAAAFLCLVNLLIVERLLPESASHESRAQAKSAPRGLLRKRMLEILAQPRRPVSRLVLIYTTGMMGFMAMNAVLALFLQARFGFTETSIGYVYTSVGVVSVVMRSLILGPTVRWRGELGVMRLGALSLVLGFALQPFAPTLPVYALTLLLIPIGTALLFPATSSLVSRFAERHELGAVMGVQQAYGGVARLFGPAWAGAAFQLYGSGAPFWISSALAAVALALAFGLERVPTRSVAETLVAKSEASSVSAGG